MVFPELFSTWGSRTWPVALDLEQHDDPLAAGRAARGGDHRSPIFDWMSRR